MAMDEALVTRRQVVVAGAVATAAAGVASALGSTQRRTLADEAPAEGQTAAEEQVDVVVLGAGGAGLAAAATAGEAGAKVVLLEAGSFAGGATIYSGGHMLWLDDEFNAAQERNDEELQQYLDLDPADFGDAAQDVTALQEQVQAYLADTERTGSFDSIERVMVDHYTKGCGADLDGNPFHMNYAMVRSAAEANLDVLAWLQSGGMEIKDSRYGSHANSPVNGGSSLIEALTNLAESAGVEIRYESRGTGVIMEGGTAVGVRYEDAEGAERVIRAARVVIATGGYSSNGAMAAMYQGVGRGLSANCGTTNPPTNRGEGMAMAQRSGAAVRDLQFLCTVLEGYHGGCTLAEAGKIVGSQQLVVNVEGRRFVDDSKSGPLKSTMNNQFLNDQTDGLAFFIGDAKMIAAINEAQEGFADELAERDWFCVADTLEDVAAAAGLDPAALAETVAAFNGYAGDGTDPDFGRTEFNGAVEEAPFAVAKMEAHYHLTFGGLLIDENSQVIDVDGNPIPGLYAAGDVVDGFEGVTHQSGDCLSVVVHTGIVAGTLA